MAKLTKNALKSFEAANKPLEILLNKTRSTIDEVKALVEAEFQGEYLKKWQKMIEEYETQRDLGLNKSEVISAEEEYEKLLLAYDEKDKRAEEIPKEIQELSAKISKLKEELGVVEEEKLDIAEKLKKLEKEITINLIYPYSISEIIEEKYNVQNSKKIEEIVTLINDDSEIGEMLAKIHSKIPSQMSFSDVLNLIKTILFIKKKVAEGRKIKIYVSKELVNIFTKYTNLDEASIFTD